MKDLSFITLAAFRRLEQISTLIGIGIGAFLLGSVLIHLALAAAI